MSTVASTLLGLILALPVPPAAPESVAAAAPVPLEVTGESWAIEQGDRVIIDTKNNEGFLFHTDGRFMRFPIVTGQRRFVSYIGRYYNASTPNWQWEAKSLHIKGDRVTFGPSGRFLRLYKDGSLHTAYGFHEHRDEQEMFAEGASERFRSMGCIIVTAQMMDLIVATWEVNEESMAVISQHGIENLQEVMAMFTETSDNLAMH